MEGLSIRKCAIHLQLQLQTYEDVAAAEDAATICDCCALLRARLRFNCLSTTTNVYHDHSKTSAAAVTTTSTGTVLYVQTA